MRAILSTVLALWTLAAFLILPGIGGARADSEVAESATEATHGQHFECCITHLCRHRGRRRRHRGKPRGVHKSFISLSCFSTSLSLVRVCVVAAWRPVAVPFSHPSHPSHPSLVPRDPSLVHITT